MSTSLTLIFCVMEDKSLWKFMIGVSNSEITNGMYPPECAPKGEGGDGSCRADIEVFIPQLTPNAEGDVIDVKSPKNVEAKVTDPFEKKTSSSSIPRVHTLKCQYMGGPNFLVPCIHKGEQVWVLQYNGGNISYFWLPMGREDGLRLHEHMRWYAMNQPKSVKGKNSWSVVGDDNSYFIDINTNPGQKLIQIHTAINDSEPHGYDIRIMPEKSWLEVIDTAGNYLHLDSANTIWKMFNIMQSYVELNKTDITISCLHDLTVFAGNDIFVTAGRNRITTIGQNDTTTVGMNIIRTATAGAITDTAGTIFALTALGLMTVQAPVYNNIAAAVSFTGGEFSVTGAHASIKTTLLDLIGLVKTSFTGAYIDIVNAHGNVNGLLNW